MHTHAHALKTAGSSLRGVALDKEVDTNAARGRARPTPAPAVADSAKPALFLLGLLCCFIGGLQQIAAQPSISNQPRNASVLPGQDAEFRVVASGTEPLSYQWQFGGTALAGATNSNLLVTNVVLSNLGRYDVVVSDNAGTISSDPVWLRLARWTELVVFGSSDALQRCGGWVWPDYLASDLGIRLRRYAAGGVTSAEVRTQITSYLRSNLPTTNTLIAVWVAGGGTDLVREIPVEDALANHLANLRLLADAGARSFLMPTMFPPELVGFWRDNLPHMTSDLVRQYDALLGESLKVFQAEYALTIYRPDMFPIFTAIMANPSAYGFRDPLGSDFSCDNGHFTTAVHRLTSREQFRSLTPTLRIDSVVRAFGGNLVLNWSGGSPPFRLERTTDLVSGPWMAMGEPGFLPSATLKPLGPHEFFRVLPLGQ